MINSLQYGKIVNNILLHDIVYHYYKKKLGNFGPKGFNFPLHSSIKLALV